MAVHPHPHPAETEPPAPWTAAFPADGAGSAQPKAERPGRHAERPTAVSRYPAGMARSEPPKEAFPAGGAESAQQRAARPDHHAERLRAARRNPAEALRAAASEPPVRTVGAAVPGGLQAPRSGTAPRGAPGALHAAWRDVPAADARLAARHAAGARAWPAAAAAGQTGRAASVAGAAPAAGRAPSERQAFPGRAGRGERPAAAGAAARAGHRLRRRGPGRPDIRPRRRPARLAKGRGPAGRSRPATSVSCASFFPSFVSTCGYQAASGLNPR